MASDSDGLAFESFEIRVTGPGGSKVPGLESSVLGFGV